MEKRIIKIPAKENESRLSNVKEEQTTKMLVIDKQYFISTTINEIEKTTNFYVIKNKEIIKKISLPLTKENIQKLEKLIDSIHTKEEMFKAITEPINIRK